MMDARSRRESLVLVQDTVMENDNPRRFLGTLDVKSFFKIGHDCLSVIPVFECRLA
jgi:hypothetical protein